MATEAPEPTEGTTGLDNAEVAPEQIGTRPVDRLVALYLVAAGIPLLLPPLQPGGLVLLVAHLVGIALALGRGPAGRLRDDAARRRPRATRIAWDWYPVFLMPLLYRELEILNVAVHGGHYFDGLIQSLEAAVFASQPSLELSGTQTYLVLSEVLCVGYLSYYFIIYVPLLILYLTRRVEAFRAMMFGLMLTFFAHYLWFIYFPVQGPWFILDRPAAAVADGPACRLVEAILDAGASRGAAFPSSHLGVAVAVAVIARRVAPGMVWPVALSALGIALGAVWGGQHYAVDMVAGAVLGGLVGWYAPSLRRRLA